MTRNRDDLPQPLGPVIRRWEPGMTERLRLGTTTSMLGVTIGTSHSKMLPSGLSHTSPATNIEI